jgi:low temperature requirement protein LtrA
VAVAIDLASAWRAGDGEWRLYPGHFAERHGLFVIIALGESLIIAGAGSTDTGLQVGTVLPPVLVTAALWWTYFGWAKDAMEEAGAATPSARRGAFSRDVYSLLHYLVVAGVISFAVAIEETVAHPGEHLEPVGVAALVIGVALFVGGTGVALLRAGAGLPTVRVAAVGVLIVASPLLATVPATTAMALVAATVTAVAVIEHRGRRGRAHVAASD